VSGSEDSTGRPGIAALTKFAEWSVRRPGCSFRKPHQFPGASIEIEQDPACAGLMDILLQILDILMIDHRSYLN